MLHKKNANFLDKFVIYMMYGNCLIEIIIGIALSIILPIEVFFRYVLNSSLFVIEELSRMLFVWFGLLGVTIALHEGSHIGFDLIKNRLTGVTAKITSSITSVLILLYAIVIAYGCILILPKQMIQLFATMRIPIFWSYLSVAVGMIILAIRSLYTLICLLTKRRENLFTVAEMFEKKTGEEILI